MNICNLITSLRLAAETEESIEWSNGCLCALEGIEKELNLGDPVARLWYSALPDMMAADALAKEIFGDDVTIAYARTKTYAADWIFGHVITSIQFDRAGELFEQFQDTIRQRGKHERLVFTLGGA